MNRAEFMRQLESLLQNISPMERQEALQYYNDYFDDAGEENELSVIEALGNPAKVAENIKRDLYGNGYGDAGFQRALNNNRAVVQYQQNTGNTDNTGTGSADTGTASQTTQKEKMPTWLVVLLVILCVFASPAILGIVFSVVGVLFGALMTWFGFIFAAAVTTVCMLGAMVILLVVAVMTIVVSPLSSVALLGGALVCGGIGILALMLTVAMAGIATPAIFKGIGFLWNKMTGTKQAA